MNNYDVTEIRGTQSIDRVKYAFTKNIHDVTEIRGVQITDHFEACIYRLIFMTSQNICSVLSNRSLCLPDDVIKLSPIPSDPNFL